MTRKFLPVLAATVTATLSPALLAQDGVCNFDWRPHYEQLTRYVSGPGTSASDAKTWLLRTESATAPLASLRETWYVARSSQGSETAPFNRLFSGADHMDSPFASEGSYSTQLALDFPWTSAAKAGRTPAGTMTSGLTPISRYLRASPFDHQTWLTSQAPAGYGLEATYNGADGVPERLGYERFGNLLSKADVLGTNGSGPAYGTHFLDNAVLRVDFNKIWGNAVGRITQLGSGRQIVLEPIGDMVQTVVRFPDSEAFDDPDCFNPNPTQSGSIGVLSNTHSWTGSPTLSSTKTVHDATTGLQSFTTVVRPLEFGNQREGWSGVEEYSPLAWKGFIERTDTLGCKVGALTRKDVVKTISRLILAPNNSLTSQNVFSLNTYWLRPAGLTDPSTPQTWDFKIDCLNLRTGAIRQLLAGADLTTCEGGAGCADLTCGDDDNNANTAPDDHAIIVSRNDETFGFAVVRFNLVVNEGTQVILRCGSPPCDHEDKGGIIIQAIRNRFSSRSALNKTTWSVPLESFLVVNNRAAIMTRLNELKGDDKSCVN
jgi:hypothetical protein